MKEVKRYELLIMFRGWSLCWAATEERSDQEICRQAKRRLLAIGWNKELWRRAIAFLTKWWDEKYLRCLPEVAHQVFRNPFQSGIFLPAHTECTNPVKTDHPEEEEEWRNEGLILALPLIGRINRQTTIGGASVTMTVFVQDMGKIVVMWCFVVSANVITGHKQVCNKGVREST